MIFKDLSFDQVECLGIKVLVACEQSQTVCKEFRCLGIQAFSNDILPSYGGSPQWHIIGDAAQVVKGCAAYRLENGEEVIIDGRWDMIIAHPPCTMLTHVSAVALAQGKHTLDDVKEGAAFFMQMLNAPCDHLAVENPAPMKIAGLPKYDQIINPYDYGHPYSKRLCLWLRGLPLLLPTHARYINHSSWLLHCAGNSRRRSKTFEGIAGAMANQWGGMLVMDKLKFNK